MGTFQQQAEVLAAAAGLGKTNLQPGFLGKSPGQALRACEILKAARPQRRLATWEQLGGRCQAEASPVWTGLPRVSEAANDSTLCVQDKQAVRVLDQRPRG
jgi:hypothetical protein